MRSIARASAVTSDGRSSEWIASNSATASSALFDWSWPTRCSSISAASRSAGHFSCASCTRFSPKRRWPASISGRIASAPWVLDTAISATSSASRPASRAARAIWARTSARRLAASSTMMRAAIGAAMRVRHPLPRVWLMTDERMGDALWDAVERLPRGAGVVFRHYRLDRAARRALFARLAGVARRRRLVLLRAGPERLGRHEAGAHGARGRGLRTAPAHSRREALAAIRAGAQMLFVSPVHATRSHPGARPLGRVRLGLMIHGLGVPVWRWAAWTRRGSPRSARSAFMAGRGLMPGRVRSGRPCRYRPIGCRDARRRSASG